MRLQPPDQLSVALLWLAALFMAAKSAVESWPAASAAIPAMSAPWLGFLPLVLLSFAAILSIVRRPLGEVPTPAAGGQQIPDGPKGSPESLRELFRVLRAGDQANSMGRRASEVNKIRPRLRAAMLTLQKEYGIPKLPDTGHDNLNWGYELQLLRDILPLIKEGHLSEARAEADKS